MKKMILGIAIILFGIAIVIGGVGDVSGFFTYIGWAISLIGLIYVIAGYLKSDKTKGPRAVYLPVFTKKEFHEKYAKDVVEGSYDNSILEFVRAYTAGHKLDDTEKAELSAYIQDL